MYARVREKITHRQQEHELQRALIHALAALVVIAHKRNLSLCRAHRPATRAGQSLAVTGAQGNVGKREGVARHARGQRPRCQRIRIETQPPYHGQQTFARLRFHGDVIDVKLHSEISFRGQ